MNWTNWEKHATQQLCAPGMNTGPLGTRLNARKKQSVNLEQMGAAGPAGLLVLCTVYIVNIQVYGSMLPVY
jgi:hypothetical protein